jgi:hypothetical protein
MFATVDPLLHLLLHTSTHCPTTCYIERLALCYPFHAFVHSASLASRHRFHMQIFENDGSNTLPVYFSPGYWLVAWKGLLPNDPLQSWPML